MPINSRKINYLNNIDNCIKDHILHMSTPTFTKNENINKTEEMDEKSILTFKIEHN